MAGVEGESTLEEEREETERGGSKRGKESGSGGAGGRAWAGARSKSRAMHGENAGVARASNGVLCECE